MVAFPVVLDAGPNKIHGVLQGSPSVSTVDGYSAMFFDGTDAAAATASLLIGGGENDLIWTSIGEVELRIKRDRSGLLEKVAGHWDNIGNDAWLLYFSADNKLNVAHRDNSGGYNLVIASSSGTITDTNWHVIKFVHSGTAIEIFIDGASQGTTSCGATNRQTRMPVLRLGRAGDNAADNFRGYVNYFKILDGATTLLNIQCNAVTNLPNVWTKESTFVLEKGGTYDGWAADALAAPSVCWDGTRWVMTVSFWSITNSEWASGFFTSTNGTIWSYVSGSLLVPSGSNYILGNSGLAWFASEYWFAYNQYVPADIASGTGTGLLSSTNLTTWTTEHADIPNVPAYAADPCLTVNPYSSRMELWYINISREICMADTTDGTTWVDRGQQYKKSWRTVDHGEPDVFYYGGYRYLSFDNALLSGQRSLAVVRQKRISGDDYHEWEPLGFAAEPSGTGWDSTNVFDSANLGYVSLAPGDPPRFWMYWAGGNAAEPSDNTQSSIGLVSTTAYAAATSTTVGSPVRHRRPF